MRREPQEHQAGQAHRVGRVGREHLGSHMPRERRGHRVLQEHRVDPERLRPRMLPEGRVGRLA